MEPSSSKILCRAALFVGALVATSFVVRVLLSPSAGGIGSAMFTTTGIVTDVSREDGLLTVEVEEGPVFDRGGAVTFDFAHDADELEKAELGEPVSVYHWFASRDDGTIPARSLSDVSGEDC